MSTFPPGVPLLKVRHICAALGRRETSLGHWLMLIMRTVHVTTFSEATVSRTSFVTTIATVAVMHHVNLRVRLLLNSQLLPHLAPPSRHKASIHLFVMTPQILKCP